MRIEYIFRWWLLSVALLCLLLLLDIWYFDEVWWQQGGWWLLTGLLFVWVSSAVLFVWRFLHQGLWKERWFELAQVVSYSALLVALARQVALLPTTPAAPPLVTEVVSRLGAPAVHHVELASDLMTATSAAALATPSATPSAAASLSPRPRDPYASDPDLADANWGEAVKVSDTGYRMKVGFDERMATADETLQALNIYRYTKGRSNLTWDERLATYARERASYICANGSDGHAGFDRYVSEEEGYKILGFYKLGENMSTHMRLTGVHLIEWMYAASPSHDANQLGDWSHVGVGISGDCSVLIFGNWMI